MACAFFNDICVFILHASRLAGKYVGMRERTLNEYKEGEETFDTSTITIFCGLYEFKLEYCFLRARCTPSQRISHLPLDVLIYVFKTKGGIKSPHCTCTAG